MARRKIMKTNAAIASVLASMTDLLESQGAGESRIGLWRSAADIIGALERPVVEIVAEEGLEALGRMGIAQAPAAAVCEIIDTGRFSMLERLRGESDPVARIASVPGMGRKLAHRAYLTLGIESLSELEHAAADGRLRKVAGFGPKRVVAVRDVLIARLRRGPRPAGAGEPAPIAELLDVDREYRERTDSGTLPMFAPRRFNPNGEAWMPVLHTVRGVRHYTGLYSNTALAHRLGRTRDWVVLYYDDSQGERQCTIVTAQRGPLTGLRIVRGREQQCVMHYHLNSRRAGLLVASSA